MEIKIVNYEFVKKYGIVNNVMTGDYNVDFLVNNQFKGTAKIWSSFYYAELLHIDDNLKLMFRFNDSLENEFKNNIISQFKTVLVQDIYNKVRQKYPNVQWGLEYPAEDAIFKISGVFSYKNFNIIDIVVNGRTGCDFKVSVLRQYFNRNAFTINGIKQGISMCVNKATKFLDNIIKTNKVDLFKEIISWCEGEEQGRAVTVFIDNYIKHPNEQDIEYVNKLLETIDICKNKFKFNDITVDFGKYGVYVRVEKYGVIRIYVKSNEVSFSFTNNVSFDKAMKIMEILNEN